MSTRIKRLPGWEDFEPEGDRQEMAYALMVAGECIDIPGTDGCRLDYDLADRILEALEHRGLGLATVAVERLQADLPAGWHVMVGFTTECRYCPGWWATASARLGDPPYYPTVVSSETGRPRGEHHDPTLAAAVAMLRVQMAAHG